jgi:hypothetical protein
LFGLFGLLLLHDDSAKMFYHTKCYSCQNQLDIHSTSLHFLCGHSFHQRCLGENENQCPKCLPEFKRVLEVKRMLEESANQHDVFFKQVALLSMPHAHWCRCWGWVRIARPLIDILVLVWNSWIALPMASPMLPITLDVESSPTPCERTSNTPYPHQRLHGAHTHSSPSLIVSEEMQMVVNMH